MVSRWILTVLLIACAPSGPAEADPASGKIALVQLNSAKIGDRSLMLADARSAKAAGAQMIVFPETADMSWLNPNAFFAAAPIAGEVTDKLAGIGRIVGIWVVAGLAERGQQIATQPVTYEDYDSAVMIDPTGTIVLHHRKFNVLKNAFSTCPAASGSQGCSYTPGQLSETKVAETHFGTVGLFVCADAYAYDTASLDALKPYHPDLVVIPWGITAGSPDECGKNGFNATGYAAQAAAYLQTAYVLSSRS